MSEEFLPKHIYFRYSPEITHTSGFHFFEKAKGYPHFLIALALCVLSFSFNKIEGWMLGGGEREMILDYLKSIHQSSDLGIL